MQMKVMLVDDHVLFLEGLEYVLETYGVEVIAKAGNGNEALIKARQLKPDVILMDIRMPLCNGLDALRLIKTELPQIKIIMLTTSEEGEDLFDAIKYGASGYLIKNTDAESLVGMLNAVLHGEISLSPEIATKVLKEFKKAEDKPMQEEEGKKLTKRQLEVLEMTAKGNTYKVIGETLGISERTVKYHMENIIELLQLENRAQVIKYVAEHGLL